jgi:tetratricopeptide (TPR) repeat protein
MAATATYMPAQGTRRWPATTASGADIYRELDDQAGLTQALVNLGYAHHQLGDFDEATAVYQQTAGMCHAIGHSRGEAEALILLGDSHEAAGDLRAAGNAWRQALKILGDKYHTQADRVRAKLSELPADAVQRRRDVRP